MKKKFTLFIMLLTIGSWNLHAQQNQFSFGIKAGANLSDAIQETNYVNAGKPTAKVGYQIGATAEYSPRGTFYLSSGLSVSNKGAIFKGAERWIGGSNPPVTSWKKTTNQIYLQLPVAAGYNIHLCEQTSIKLNAGLYFAYGIGGKEIVKTKTTPSEAMKDEKFVYDTFDENNNESYSPYNLDRKDYGATFGIGFRCKKFTIGLDYELGLLNIYKVDKTELSTSAGTYKNRNLALTVGYVLK